MLQISDRSNPSSAWTIWHRPSAHHGRWIADPTAVDPNEPGPHSVWVNERVPRANQTVIGLCRIRGSIGYAQHAFSWPQVSRHDGVQRGRISDVHKALIGCVDGSSGDHMVRQRENKKACLLIPISKHVTPARDRHLSQPPAEGPARTESTWHPPTEGGLHLTRSEW